VASSPAVTGLVVSSSSGSRLIQVRFFGPEENTMRRAMSRDHVSYVAWSISDTSGHALDAWSRQIRNQGYASASVVFIHLDRWYY